MGLALHKVIRTLRNFLSLPAILLLAAMVAGCTAQAERQEMIVFAAASLGGPLQQIEAEFEKSHPGWSVKVSFAGSQELRTQIELGATADVFISADEGFVLDLVEKGLLMGPISAFARNRLAVLIAPGNPAAIGDLSDLAGPGVRLVLANPRVPVGHAAREALEWLGQSGAYGADFLEQAMANVVSEETSARGVVSRVTLGEADAGLAYVTDALAAAKDGVEALALPPEMGVKVDYVAGAIPPGDSSPAAEFVRFLSSSAARRILEAHGFVVG